MTLDEEPRKFTTINTHSLQYNRLLSGVSSVPAIFQRTMKNLLQGIPHVIVWMDDILVGEKEDNNHLANLEAVLKEVVRNWIAAAERELLLLTGLEFKFLDY